MAGRAEQGIGDPRIAAASSAVLAADVVAAALHQREPQDSRGAVIARRNVPPTSG
jgi:hypothetical protein